MSFRIVNTATRRPGKCALSGDNSGPFIDTGKDIRRYGRVYLSIKFFDEPLRQLGYIGPDETKKLETELDTQENYIRNLVEKERTLEQLVEAVSPYIPNPEPEIVKVKERVTRDPTNDEIAQWIKENGADNPVVQEASRVEKGSTEEWNRLYRDNHAKYDTDSTNVEVKEEPEIVEVDNEGPPKVYTLMDQEINIDDILVENIGTINIFLEEKDEEFIAAVIRREYYLAEKNSREVRKGILKANGYWDNEDDSPLYPEDEDTTKEQE